MAMFVSGSATSTGSFGAVHTAGNVVIGTTTNSSLKIGPYAPAGILGVYGDASILSNSNSLPGILEIRTTDSTTLADDIVARIFMESSDGGESTLDAGTVIEAIASQVHSAIEKGHHLAFRTKADNTNLGEAATERMRITSAGKVGIGTSAPSQLVHAYVASSDAMHMIETAGSSKARWGMIASDNGGLYFKNIYSGGFPLCAASGSSTTVPKIGIGNLNPEVDCDLEIGDISTGPGGMLIKRMTIVEDTATTFWTTPGANEWAGIVEITAVATDDVNRSAYQLSRFAYDDEFTSLIASAQNTSITLSIASTTQMQITMTGAGSTNYRLVIRLMGSEES